MKRPSKYVLKQTAIVTIIAALVSISASTGIRIILGVQSDTITIIVRLILPFAIAIPIGLVWFSKYEHLEKTYRALVKHANELAQTASTDPLTGLMNRRSFIEQFDGAMQIGVRGWFLIADIDYLKNINDQYGHVVGDDAVIAIATAMEQELPSDSLIARIGGDEFCAFISIDVQCEFNAVLNNINEAASLIFKRKHADLNTQLSISAGHMICKPKQTFADIMSMTDENLYRKKRSR